MIPMTRTNNSNDSAVNWYQCLSKWNICELLIFQYTFSCLSLQNQFEWESSLLFSHELLQLLLFLFRSVRSQVVVVRGRDWLQLGPASQTFRFYLNQVNLPDIFRKETFKIIVMYQHNIHTCRHICIICTCNIGSIPGRISSQHFSPRATCNCSVSWIYRNIQLNFGCDELVLYGISLMA